MKILIIPDKFKGTLTAREAGEAIAGGWKSIREEDDLEILPMSDGGDGFGEVIGGTMGAREVKVESVDAAHRPREASFWWHARSKTAIIEAAQSNGLAFLPPGKFHPFDLDTYGLGKIYEAALAMKPKKVKFGIGGSATNDGGFGFARAIGWKFVDYKLNEITKWTDLDRLKKIRPPRRLEPVACEVAVDVQNPLLGPNGASRIYGPQKGLREGDMAKAEACLQKLAEAAAKMNGKSKRDLNFAELPGAGAAGGLGFGLAAFLGARFVPGADLFARAARLDERLKSVDVVISGEGSIDQQSLMGKGVGAIFDRCRKAGVRCIGLGGSLGPGVQNSLPNDRLTTLMAIVPNLTTLKEAKAQPARWLRALAAEAAKKVTLWPES